jgi:hypothetical protein
VDGVACVKVDFNQREAVVRGSAKFEDLAAAVEQAGFIAKSALATGAPGSDQASSCCQSEIEAKLLSSSTKKMDTSHSKSEYQKLTSHKNLKSNSCSSNNSSHEVGSLADNQ